MSKALDSIVCQTFSDWEVLIMDGISTDDTLKIAQSYNDSRIRIYSEPDKGIYDAMNKGIKKAQGEWLYFLGSDDRLLDKNVLSSIFTMDINQYDVVYGDVEASHLDSMHKGEWSMPSINFNRCHQAIFYRKGTFKKIGYYDLTYPIWADYDLNLKWFFSTKLRNKYIPLNIAHYSDGGASSTCTDSALTAKFPYIILTRAKKSLCRNQKINLISESLQSVKLSFLQKLHLEIWLFELKQITILKKFLHKRQCGQPS